MPEVIISASGTQFGLIVNPDGSINTAISGNIVIGSVSATVDSIYVQSGDNINLNEGDPNATNKLNSAIQLIYSGTVIGSLIQFPEVGGGSFVKVLTYDGTDQLINVGSWV